MFVFEFGSEPDHTPPPKILFKNSKFSILRFAMLFCVTVALWVLIVTLH